MSQTHSQKPPLYGPGNPHPLSKMRTELVWDGKETIGKDQSTLEMVV
jgi:hypothetical protein